LSCFIFYQILIHERLRHFFFWDESRASTPSTPTTPTTPASSPTNYPTNYPTKAGTVTIEVTMSLTASARPTDADKSAIKAQIVESLGVSTSDIKSFTVTYETMQRRHLLVSASALGGRRLAEYTWKVSFSVVAVISEDSITETLEGDAFESALLSSVTSVSGVEAVAATEAGTGSEDNKGDDDDNEDDGALVVIIIVVAVVVFIIIGGAAYMYKQKQQSSGKIYTTTTKDNHGAAERAEEGAGEAQ
jgi:hypothetical protein